MGKMVKLEKYASCPFCTLDSQGRAGVVVRHYPGEIEYRCALGEVGKDCSIPRTLNEIQALRGETNIILHRLCNVEYGR